ncbi:hypothetical protein TRFO_14343 [Tritrichomonas foetus]|uniref:Uncharacterized protein n=1 Tax=Tritrichomonas foetus TaxID=1144522 RepID=A0A1J4KVJ7_9EUKA|nr:hypothetical protein TRFO_14343 [Tritrichomonas foetus]|eukprot:OHT15170.1 hypothetical protein TRFO_14343 [Tritrichomonas foetus]
MLQSDQRKLEIEREESYRELWNSVQIEKKLKCQLYSLLKQAKSLAEDRKWHQYTIDENEQKNPNLSFFNNSFSIP